MSKRLTHIDDEGQVRMVDVGAKPPMRRRAVATCLFQAPPHVLDMLLDGSLPKGEALAAARIAGIGAAKRCDALIPLCHTLPLDAVEVHFERVQDNALQVRAVSCTTARTGVEMEALIAASIAALTLWDMTKAVTKDLCVTDVVLVEKTKEPLESS